MADVRSEKDISSTLGGIADSVRSKNAGPFWITIDIFCGDARRFEAIGKAMSLERFAKETGVSSEEIKRYEVSSLHVLKFSLKRTHVQGSRKDRDMHGAQIAHLVSSFSIQMP